MCLHERDSLAIFEVMCCQTVSTFLADIDDSTQITEDKRQVFRLGQSYLLPCFNTTTGKLSLHALLKLSSVKFFFSYAG